MANLHHHPVRVVRTRAGTRYVVQVPYPSASYGGWRAYAVLATGPGREDRPLHLTLYDRPGGPMGGPDGARAA